MSARVRGEDGFTLLELLRMHAGVARRLQTRLASVGGAGWALAVAARDAETAGGDPQRSGVEALPAASRDRVILGADRDGNGSVAADTAERVTLAWSSSSGGRFVRWLGNQSISIASQVRSGGLHLRYFDAAGNEIAAAGAGEIAAADRARVRRVALELEVIERAGVFESRTALRAAAALRMRLEER